MGLTPIPLRVLLCTSAFQLLELPQLRFHVVREGACTVSEAAQHVTQQRIDQLHLIPAEPGDVERLERTPSRRGELGGGPPSVRGKVAREQ